MVDSKHQWKAWLYLSPAIILLLIFTVWPIINTLIMAFSDGYSSMKSQRVLRKDSAITIYGELEENGRGTATFADGAKFYFGEGIVDNDDAFVKDVFVNKINNVKGSVTLKGIIANDPVYDSSDKSWSFQLEVENASGDPYIATCNKVKELAYEFDLSSGDSSRVFVTGKFVKTDKTITVGKKTYPLFKTENATYVSDLNTGVSKKEELNGKVSDLVAQLNNLEVNASTEEVTLSSTVYSIETIHDDKHVTIICQARDSDGNNAYVECVNLVASERSGLKLGDFFFGISNFKQVVNYAQFGQCLLNTMLLTILTVPISTLLALLIAVCLNAIRPLKRLLQTIFFLPYVTNSIAIGMVFATMFNIVGYTPVGEPAFIGIINYIIEIFGGTRINWINQGSSYAANIAVMTIYIVWNALPFKILILLGGLQSVNKQYYDAAKVDGTSRSRTFWRITVPLLSPMIAYVVITGFIGGFKEYSSIVGVFGDSMGPPGDKGRLNTMVGFIYNAIADDVQGKASAAALILFCIILVVTLINLSVSKRKVHY